MPVVYRCSHCGAPLEIFVKVGQNSYGVPTPSEVANRYAGRCYYCGKPLNLNPGLDDIEVDVKGVRERMRKLLFEARRRLKIDFRNLEPYISLYLKEEAREEELATEQRTVVEEVLDNILGVPRGLGLARSGEDEVVEVDE